MSIFNNNHNSLKTISTLLLIFGFCANLFGIAIIWYRYTPSFEPSDLNSHDYIKIMFHGAIPILGFIALYFIYFIIDDYEQSKKKINLSCAIFSLVGILIILWEFTWSFEPIIYLLLMFFLVLILTKYSISENPILKSFLFFTTVIVIFSSYLFLISNLPSTFGGKRPQYAAINFRSEANNCERCVDLRCDCNHNTSEKEFHSYIVSLKIELYDYLYVDHYVKTNNIIPVKIGRGCYIDWDPIEGFTEFVFLNSKERCIYTYKLKNLL